MMNDLTRAELRKIVSTKVWWALLIPAALLGFVVNLLGGAVGGLLLDTLSDQLGGAAPPVLGISLAVSLGLTSTFCLALGIIGTAGEHQHKTITTTYLTAPGRGVVLAAKMQAFAGVGALYGVVIVVVGVLGGLIAGGTAQLATPLDLLLVALVGIVSLVLWTLIGLGVGSLVSNQVVALVSAVLGKLLLENLLEGGLTVSGAEEVVAVLPSTASGAFTDRLALDLFVERLPAALANQVSDFGGLYTISWWAGGLVLAGWAIAFALGGWFVARQRDVL